MKKPFIQSPLDRMPLNQRQALTTWLTTGGTSNLGITYKAASARLRTEFGVRVSHIAVHNFYHRHHLYLLHSNQS